jgi:pyruvate kinase
MRRAKIVCTLGPAVDGVAKLTELIGAGMNVARLNMSHGNHAEHGARLAAVREAAQAAGKHISVFADLQGPKIRLGEFPDGPVTLVAGQRFTITTEDVAGTAERASTTLKTLTDDVTPGDQVLIDDGRLTLRAVEVTATDVVCEVVVGGPVSDHKGINLPGVPVSVPAMSDKDADDLRWALENGVDMVALSFVRSPADIEPVHAIMEGCGRRVPVIAKIEKPQAVSQLNAIVDAFDALMVARGDLGVELPFEEVPLVQKRIIEAARRWNKPVIVATQMLESMISAPRPTRAEASDVATAVLDGADAVMLSGETSVGEYPVEAVAAMDRIISSIEARGFDKIATIPWDPHTISGAVSLGATEVAGRLGAKYIVAFSWGGDTAKRVARLRTQIPVCCFTPNAATRGRLGIVWGLRTFVSKAHGLVAMIEEMDETLVGAGLVETGDTVVVIYGTPLGAPAHTNTVYVHEVGSPMRER